jgi:ATP-dependent protease ClpP protease subunit
MMELGEKYSIKLTAEEAKEKGIIHEIVEKFDFLKAA